MKNVCIPLGSQFSIKYVKENVFIFLPKPNIKKNVYILLGANHWYDLFHITQHLKEMGAFPCPEQV